MSNPSSAWHRLRTGNELFSVPDRSSRSELISDRPVAAVFRCADTAMASEMVFGQNWGSLMDVSTWGHVIDTGVLGTLEYAVDTLEVPLIVVLGHHGCTAMSATMRAWHDAEMPDGAARAMVEQAMSSILRRGSAADSLAAITTAHVVETGLALLDRSPAIGRRVDAANCGIVCAATDQVSGRVRVYATIGAVGETDGALLECV
ncbi:carbonic anhydrase [Mycolicibacterium hodleri]|uniref:Carbonic anhydrase n=1 Tax=Mycolicibacterium hodleri TaxID=49897 RepID=A0A502E4A0_9MYCO|nr:carbonic anhydrase [Mycolicibacterium hodleri]TPG32535.1 carbonic anhydrase [Mycolicibacterium hodleri]